MRNCFINMFRGILFDSKFWFGISWMRKFRLRRLPLFQTESGKIWWLFTRSTYSARIQAARIQYLNWLATLAMLLKGLVTSGRPHCWWLWCANIATSISGTSKHSCAPLLLNNIYFFGSSLACWTLFWQLRHTSAVCQSHICTLPGSHVWCAAAHVLPHFSPAASSDTCSLLNPRLNKQSNPTPATNFVSCQFISAPWNMSDNRKRGRVQG